jgi:chromosome segregation ATPase
MTPDCNNASVELQNIESPVGAHEKDDKEQGSFEVPLFNFDEVMWYMRKLKEENTLLKEQLETMQKEYDDKQEMFKDLEESFDQRTKMLSQEKMELEMTLQKVLQYGTVKDMERVLEKCGEMEQKVEDMKRDIKEEMKEEMKKEMEKKCGDMEQNFGEMKKQLKQEFEEDLQQQLKITIEEHEEKLSSFSNRTEQVSREMEFMKSKLSELESQVLADNFTVCGIKYIRKMKVKPLKLHTEPDQDELTIHTAIDIYTGRNRPTQRTVRWILFLC